MWKGGTLNLLHTTCKNYYEMDHSPLKKKKKTEKRLGLVSDFLEKKKIQPLKY